METRQISDLVKFLDPTGSISDAEASSISRKLKFSDVLDLISLTGKDEVDQARNVIAAYDDRFASQPTEESQVTEYSNVPSTPHTKSMFAPIKPKGPVAPGQTQSNNTGNDVEDSELDADLEDKLAIAQRSGHSAEVNQIKSLLQRITK
jgi:hypothetical protein